MTRIEVEIMKKGFSLIELLAVIVILAIIAIIATPIVLNIINDTKESSLLRSAEFYLNAVEQSITQLNAENGGNFNPKSCEIEENGNIICDKNKDNVITLKLDGEKPDGGTITIEDGKINKVELYYKDKLITNKESKKLEYSPVIYKKVEDSNPGIICGETAKEDLNQTTCYIKSIEDLVELSTLVNKGTTFENKKVELIYSLDFNSKRSYASKEVKEALITGTGFSSIGTSSKNFKGIFEGNGNTIKGLYGGSLFSYIKSAIIQNLTIEDSNVNGNKKAILVGFNYGGTIQNINLYNTNLSSTARGVGSLVGYNENGTIKNIKAQNITVFGGQYYETGGLVGENKESLIENIELENVNMTNETFSANGMIGDNSGTVQNVKARNINIKSIRYSGGLVRANSGVMKDIDVQNINIYGEGEYFGGIASTNSGSLENIKIKNINLEGAYSTSGGIAGFSAGTIKNIIGDSLNVSVRSRYCGGLVGGNSAGIISQIKLRNINVKGAEYTGLGVGINSKGNIKNIVVHGNVDGNNYIGGIVGISNGTSSDELSQVSGIYLSGNVIGAGGSVYRTVGASTNTTLNTLASSSITVKGNTVVSDDPTSLNGKSLDNMGKAAKSVFEALGFNFDPTSESYWYFNENDELDLIIK